MADAAATPGVEGTEEEANVTDVAAVEQAAADKKAADEKATAGERPEGLPEKFKTVADMVASYAELEKKQSQSSPKPNATGDIDDLAIDTTKPTVTDGINISALETEYNDNDGLSDKTYEALAKQGIDRAAADSIIEGRLAQGMQIRSEMAEVTGGEEQLQATLAWAKDNADKTELAAYNAAIKSKSPGSIRLALRGLHAGRVAAEGITPELLDGEGRLGSGVKAYENQAAMVNAMSDPRYKTSPAYREEVGVRTALME